MRVHLLLVAILLAGCVAQATPQTPPTPTALPTLTPSPSGTQTLTSSPMPSVTPTPVPQPALANPHTSAKKGLALSVQGGCCWENWRDARIVGAKWLYFWWPTLKDTGEIEAVPMMSTLETVGMKASGNSNWIMGFNEPDLPEQANMTPEIAAEAWRTIEISNSDKLLLSPAPSDQHPEWLAQFRDVFMGRYGRPPRMDAVAAHCYMTEPQCERYVQARIDEAHQWGINSVWVTEFAYADPSDLARFVRWMEANPDVARYAVYVDRASADFYRQWALFDSDGMMTELGQDYRCLP